MTSTTKALVLRALAQFRGDDLERAERAFRGLSPEVMNKEYGMSGQTRRQIIENYRAHVAQVQAAIAEVEGL